MPATAFDELLANYDAALLLFEGLQQPAPADAAPAQTQEQKRARAHTPPGTAITWRTGDYAELAGGGWDAIVSSLVAHHMTQAQLVAFLRFMEAEAARERGEQRKAGMRETVAVQVVDQPAARLSPRRMAAAAGAGENRDG